MSEAVKPTSTPQGSPTAPSRSESDSMGKMDVPADRYYGAQTARAIENFRISGIPVGHFPAFVRALVSLWRSKLQNGP